MPYATLPIFISRIRTTCMPAVIAIMFSAIAAKANDSDLDSNGMSPLNHARYEFDNCEEFTQLKNSGIEEYDYIDQILAGRTRHSPDDIKRIRQIRAEFKKISNQLKKAKKYQYRDVIDHLKELQDYDEGGDPPYTETIYELTAHYYRDNLIKIEWIRAMNTPSEDTVSVFFDTTQRPLFAFTRRLESSRYHSQSRFYYDENGKTIAVATRGGWEIDRCESKAATNLESIKNYPAPLDERENPISEMKYLDEMICTAKKLGKCNYFTMKRR